MALNGSLGWAASILAVCGMLVVGCNSSDGNNSGNGSNVPGTNNGLPNNGVPSMPGGGMGGNVTDGTNTSMNGGSGNGAGTGDPGNTGNTGNGGGGTTTTGTGDGDGDGGGTGTTGSGGTWASMGFDERNWYFNPNETTLTVSNAPTLVEKWRFTTGGNPNGTPVIHDGVVYVMAVGGTYAIDLDGGTEVWSTTMIRGTASLAYADGALFAHDGPGNLYKLDPATGDTLWGPVRTNPQDGCDGTSSPIVGGGLVIVGHSCGTREVGLNPHGARGAVQAFNISDGSQAWTYWTVPASGEDGAMVWSSVGIDVAGGTVYAATGNNYSAKGENSDAIHAIDITNGMRKWKSQVRDNDLWSVAAALTGPDTDFGANPIVTPGAIAAGDKGAAFWAFDPATGTELWSREKLSTARDPAHGGFLMNGAFDGTTFYGVSNDTGAAASQLYAMDAATGADKFPPKRFMGKYAWGAPSLANGLLAVPINDDLYVLDASNGNELIKFNTGGTIAAGAPAIAAGHIVVGSGLQYPFGPDAVNNTQVIAYGLP